MKPMQSCTTRAWTTAEVYSLCLRIRRLMRIMTYSGLDNFYLTNQQLQNLPSHKDGIDAKCESALRFAQSLLIREIGIKLRQPQPVMATGQVLFHRFFCVTSFARYDARSAAKACAWLASKLEECPNKIHDVVLLYRHIDSLHLPRPLGSLTSDEFAKLRNNLFVAEMDVLHALGFVCHMELPYTFLLVYLEKLEASRELKQVAWSLTNDSFCTTLCVRFRSPVVACGAVHAAARKLKVALPNKWFEVLSDVKWEEIEIVCQVLLRLYKDAAHSSPPPVTLPCQIVSANWPLCPEEGKVLAE